MVENAERAVARCLNCDAPLAGRFCAECGQRAVPPHPTVRELVGDAWNEFSGDDGRLMRTLRGLFDPGRLTIEYVEGHRARYISPVRLYLTASVVYFLIAVAAPTLDTRSDVVAPGIRIGVREGATINISDPAQREELLKQTEGAPWYIRPALRAALEDPAGFRRRVFESMSRVFFALLPVFAVITALFFRRRTFPTHLTFATHLHSFVFVALAVSELSKFARQRSLAATAAGIVGVTIAVYALLALKRVYREGWGRTAAKAAGIAVLYVLSAIPAFFVILAWASMTR